jgi:GNAT superfamily N-acetyltransferase
MTTTIRPIGIFYSWWRRDRLEPLPPLDGLTIDVLGGDDLEGVRETTANWIDPAEAETIARRGDRLYRARLDGVIAAFGWSAVTAAEISELGIDQLRLPPGNRYLWGFVTEPDYRGRGLYPRLLQAVLQRDTDAERFWIGHDLDNDASASGIRRAGFSEVGRVHERGGQLWMAATGDPERAAACEALFGIPIGPDMR